MARLVAERSDLIMRYSDNREQLAEMEDEVFRQQIMIGLEGTVFLILILVGIWMIYRSLVRSEELKFHQQNFLLAVTHELKTPLASMKVNMDGLVSPKVSDEDKATIVPRIKQDIGRLEKLVENILEAGRFEKNGYRLNQESINLSNLLSERLDQMDDLISSPSIDIMRTITPDLRIMGDAPAMGRAIDAIFDNAVKYRSGDNLRLQVNLTTKGNDAVLSIVDNGLGLEAKEKAAIFERFYRVGDELTRRSEGTGLGLFLCREIIRAHGGSIFADSDGQGKGSCFTITLRLDKSDEKNSSG